MGSPANIPTAAEQMFALANQARAQAGAGTAALGSGAGRCRSVPLPAHGRGGADLAPLWRRAGSERRGPAQAGAHFSLIEENVAIGPSAAGIHEEWMNSPGHRTNLLNPEVDRVGIAVVASRGVLYAVADYARAVQSLSPRAGGGARGHWLGREGSRFWEMRHWRAQLAQPTKECRVARAGCSRAL